MTPGNSARTQHVTHVLQRLTRLNRLNDAETDLLAGLGVRRVQANAGAVLSRPGLASPQFLLSGWAAYHAELPDGRRPILRLLVPGDTFGEFPHLTRPAYELVALTQVTTTDAAPAFQEASSGAAPGLARAFALSARQHDAQMAAAVVRLSALTALERLADLMLELAERLAAAGLSDGRIFPMPVKQETLSATLGLSIVHTNRTLQQLRRTGLIELRSGVAVLLQSEELARIAGRHPVELPHGAPVRQGRLSPANHLTEAALRP